jgi:hypothetical protein
VTLIKQHFVDVGLDSVASAPYHVLLSYPDEQRPNSVQLLDASGHVTFNSRDQETDLSNVTGAVPPFNAYSPAAELEVGFLAQVVWSSGFIHKNEKAVTALAQMLA